MRASPAPHRPYATRRGFVLRWPFEQQLFEGDITAARTALSDADFDAAYSEGRALDIDADVAYAKRTRGDLPTN